MTEQDEKFMLRAIELARKGMENGAGGPFGCVVVKNGEIVGEGSNLVTSTNDPTAHAEVVGDSQCVSKSEQFPTWKAVRFTHPANLARCVSARSIGRVRRKCFLPAPAKTRQMLDLTMSLFTKKSPDQLTKDELKQSIFYVTKP